VTGVVHGRCRDCERDARRRGALPGTRIVYRWRSGSGRRLRDARCPMGHGPLTRTAVGLMNRPRIEFHGKPDFARATT